MILTYSKDASEFPLEVVQWVPIPGELLSEQCSCQPIQETNQGTLIALMNYIGVLHCKGDKSLLEMPDGSKSKVECIRHFLIPNLENSSSISYRNGAT